MPTPRTFTRAPIRETMRVLDILRRETIGGFLLAAAAITAIILANSPAADWYTRLRDTRIGYAPWHLDLTLGQWAADGLLAVFFFLVGLELKRELVDGQLRSPQTALIPIVAAVGGVIVPAALYLAVTAGDDRAGWAIPTATDIAFAVAVLALVGSRLPAALRLFLLTLAVVDDLIAILVIAVVYTEKLSWTPLLAALIPLAVYAVIAHRHADWFARTPVAAWAVLLPLGVATWILVHASGVHATIAGVLLGFAVPVRRGDGLAGHLEHRLRPLSAGFAVPVFAFFAAGVTVGGLAGLGSALTDPIAVGVAAGLLLGKPLGILAAVWLTVTLTRTRLDPALRWPDLAALSVLAGIGFTVSLLIADLSFDGTAADHAKTAVLVASTTAAVGAGVFLAVRGRRRG